MKPSIQGIHPNTNIYIVVGDMASHYYAQAPFYSFVQVDLMEGFSEISASEVTSSRYIFGSSLE